MHGLMFAVAVDEASDKFDKAFVGIHAICFFHDRQPKLFGVFKTVTNHSAPFVSMAVRMPGSDQIVGVVFDVGSEA